MIRHEISIFELFCGPGRGRPHTVIDGCLYAFMIKTFNYEESSAPAYYGPRIFNQPLDLFPASHDVLVVAPLRHDIREGAADREVDGLRVLQLVQEHRVEELVEEELARQPHIILEIHEHLFEIPLRDVLRSL